MSQKKYSIEFKEEAVRLMMIDGLTAPEVSEKLDVKTGCLYSWKSKLGKKVAAIKDLDRSTPDELKSEVKRLERELSKSKRMNEILKKTVIYFGKDQ
jgi:transposase